MNPYLHLLVLFTIALGLTQLTLWLITDKDAPTDADH